MALGIALWRFMEILTGVTVMDQVQALFIGQTPFAPSMGLLTDLSLLALTLSLILAHFKFGVLAQAAFALALGMTIVSLTGHAVGSQDYYGEMAVVTTLFMVLACAASLPKLRYFEPTKFFYEGESYSRSMGIQAVIYNGNILLLAFLFARLDERVANFFPLIVVAIIAVQLGIFLQGTFANVRTVRRESKQTDDLKRLTAEANRANDAKSKFLAVISHELRTPLTGIIGLADLLRLTKLDTEQNAHLDKLSGSAENLTTLLNEVLDFSKIEARQLDLESQPFRLSELMNGVHGLFSSSASAKGYLLELNLSSITHDMVVGDPTRIRQILSNIVNNAIKFTDKGSVSIAVAQGAEADGRISTTISVKDSGAGIPEDRMESIFNAFSQVDDTITRQYGDTGLGLSIARSLIDLMGGDIKVESVVGLGSKFSVDIPLDIATDAQIEEIKKRQLYMESRRDLIAQRLDSARDGVELRALVTDDNETIRQLVTAMLSKAGHTVETANNGKEALDAFRNEDFDYILMDMHMPVMNGIQASAAIRRDEKEKGEGDHTPIIALTADVLEENKQRCLDVGIDTVVGKPVDWVLLFEEIDRLTDQPKPQDQDVDQEHSGEPFENDEAVITGDVSEAKANTSFLEFPVMDFEVVQGLEDALGADVTNPMLLDFGKSLSEHVQVFETELTELPLGEIKKKGHAIKGLCRQFGALRLGEIGAFIEYDSKSVDEIEPLLPLMRDDATKIISLIRQRLDKAA